MGEMGEMRKWWCKKKGKILEKEKCATKIKWEKLEKWENKNGRNRRNERKWENKNGRNERKNGRNGRIKMGEMGQVVQNKN